MDAWRCFRLIIFRNEYISNAIVLYEYTLKAESDYKEYEENHNLLIESKIKEMKANPKKFEIKSWR